MIYVVIGTIGFLIVIGLQYVFAQEIRQLYQQFFILREETEQTKRRREYARVKHIRVVQEEEEAHRQLTSIREEIHALTAEIESFKTVEDRRNTIGK
jgi:hypothetical protein